MANGHGDAEIRPFLDAQHRVMQRRAFGNRRRSSVTTEKQAKAEIRVAVHCPAEIVSGTIAMLRGGDVMTAITFALCFCVISALELLEYFDRDDTGDVL
jgi:hypothetical protein